MRVFIAGPYSGKGTEDMMRNAWRGIDASRNILSNGHAVFCPFIDFLLLLGTGHEISVDKLRFNCIEWLKASDCLVLLDGWEGSSGVAAELEVAKDFSIPIMTYDDFIKKIGVQAGWIAEQYNDNNK